MSSRSVELRYLLAFACLLGCGVGGSSGEIGGSGAMSDSGVMGGDASTCAPACGGKQCGDDGCGGTCGTCGAPVRRPST